RVLADEGMWLFNDPPRKTLEAKYGFNPTDQWLEHLQRASVRFNSGGSGSFVSSDGLVITNHHVGADAIHKLSTKDTDYLKNGFYAKTRAEEIRCMDLELNVLDSIEDVTARVSAAVKPGSSVSDTFRARRAVMSTIEKDSLKKTGLRSDVVTLYQGALYHLYRYKKYTDVRLVFAPEQAIAFFGGDVDNFEYPRYDLDISFFRVYENDRPAKMSNYLKWSSSGVSEGDLVFVSGHPAHTDRMDTVAALEFIRDRALPLRMRDIFRREVLLTTFGQRSPENMRRAQDDLFGIQNSRKALLGRLAGLQDPAVISRKRVEEENLRRTVARRPASAKATPAWDQIAASLRVWGEIYDDYQLLERRAAFNSRLFQLARTLVRMAEETAKPNAKRLREFRDSNLESLRQQLFSKAPIYDDLETVKLADSLSMYEAAAGAENELVRRVLAGDSPHARAARLVRETKLDDVAVRKQLAEGGLKAILASTDPMIQLALMVDPPARRLRTIREERVLEPQRRAYAKIADARFAMLGTSAYPDATFTLRLAFGVVKGYREHGRQIPPWTTIGGLYERAAEHHNKKPFQLPHGWARAKDRLDLNTPMNFVFTADIIGGNSGSPVVNRGGEQVGIVFDGNLQSLVWNFIFTSKQGRATAVDSRAIVEALRQVYHADALADELGQ
ncbi:MAG: S46 family peptidase, partial [Thermoguttaceae bacterium]